MHLVIGLGNPGLEYENTRHNIGFTAVDSIAAKHSLAFAEKFNGLLCKMSFENDVILLFKPTTYMNLSGPPCAKVASYFKIPTQNIFVIYDDVDLKTGAIKIKTGGGSAGHNGIKSLDAHLGPGYNKVRIGVGRPENPHIPLADYVLGKFTPNEQEILQPQIIALQKHLHHLLNNDVNNFYQSFKN